MAFFVSQQKAIKKECAILPRFFDCHVSRQPQLHASMIRLPTMLLPTSVTRLGSFESFWATIFITKVAQIFGKLFGHFESIILKVKNHVVYIFGIFWRNWATFYSTIWSHRCQPIFEAEPIGVTRFG